MDATVPGNLSVDVQLPAAPQSQPQDEATRLKIPKADDDMQLKLFDEMQELNTTGDNIIKSMQNSAKNEADASKMQDSLLKEIGGNTRDNVNNTPGEKQKKKKINEYFAKKMVAADFFTSVGASLKNLGKKIGGGILDILGALMIFALLGPEFLNGIISLVLGVVTTLITAFINAIPVVVDAIVKFLPIVIDALTNAIMMIVPILANVLPKLVTMLGDAIIKLVESLAKILPILIPALINVFVAVINALVKLLPIVINALAGLIVVIVDEILKLFNDPKFINSLIDAFGQVIEALVIAMPIVINALLTLVPKLYDAIIGILAGLSDNKNLPGWLRAIFTYMTFMARVGKAVFLTLVDVIKWVIDNFDSVIDGIMMVATLLTGVFNPLFYIKLWGKVMSGINKFFTGTLIPSIVSAWEDLKSKFSLGNIVDSAKDMGKKIVDAVFGQGSFAQVTAMLHDAKETIDKIVDKFLNSEFVKDILTQIKRLKGLFSNEEKPQEGIIKEFSHIYREKKAQDIMNDIQGTKEQLVAKAAEERAGHHEEYAAALDSLAAHLQNGQRADEKLQQQMLDALKSLNRSGSDTLEAGDFNLQTYNARFAR